MGIDYFPWADPSSDEDVLKWVALGVSAFFAMLAVPFSGGGSMVVFSAVISRELVASVITAAGTIASTAISTAAEFVGPE